MVTANTAIAQEALFTAAAQKITSAKNVKEKEQILFDFYAELNATIAAIEKKPDPTKDINYLPLLESLVFFEIIMDRHNAIAIPEERTCSSYKFFMDARIDPSAESGVPVEKYTTSAKWFLIIVNSICKK